MVCGFGLVFFSFIEAFKDFYLLGCVCCESTKLSQGNPSVSLALYTISPLKGSSGCVILPGERVIGAMGCGKWVWVSCECTREVVWARNRGKGWYGFWRVSGLRTVMVTGLNEKFGDGALMALHLSFSFHFILGRVLVIMKFGK
ncbi:hypothetical protein Tco_0298255 [Tanacetum coccineum]